MPKARVFGNILYYPTPKTNDFHLERHLGPIDIHQLVLLGFLSVSFFIPVTTLLRSISCHIIEVITVWFKTTHWSACIFPHIFSLHTTHIFCSRACFHPPLHGRLTPPRLPLASYSHFAFVGSILLVHLAYTSTLSQDRSSTG